MVLAILFTGLLSAFALANEPVGGKPKAEITAKSCRLANAYFKGPLKYPYSAGILVNGKYPEKPTEAACEKECRSDEKGRKDDTRHGYQVKVACYYGEKLLFEAEHR